MKQNLPLPSAQTSQASRASQTSVTRQRPIEQAKAMPPFVDNRPEAVAQRRLQEAVNNSPQMMQRQALEAGINRSPLMIVQRMRNDVWMGGALQPFGGSGQEADIMAPTSPMGAGPGLASGMPIQGVFIRLPQQLGDTAQYWQDQENGEKFHFTGLLGSNLISLQSAARTVVVDQSGNLLESHPLPTGIHEESMDAGGNDGLVEESEPDTSKPPTMFDPKQHDGGNFPDGGISGYEALGESMSLSKLTTNLTALIALRPIHQGKFSLFAKEYKYRADDVLIEKIMLGDSDRPDTRFDNQESHTVSWTLVRNGLMGLAQQTMADFLGFMQTAYEDLSEFVQNPEGERLQSMVTGHGTLQAMRGADLPIDVWSRLCSKLLINYLQVYQLSTAATYKRGAALGHGESHAMLRLGRDNQAILEGNKPRGVTAVANDIAKLLDVQFSIDALGVGEYAFAIHHWLEMLHLTFPALMKELGGQIIKPVMSKQLAPSFKKELGMDPTASITVADLLDKKDQVREFAERKQLEFESEEPEQFERTVFEQLKTQFTANIGVMPLEPGLEQQTQGTLKGQKISFVQRVYKAGQLEIGHLQISDQDRPKTKFIKHQKSHTVPWTLAREAIRSFNQKPVPELLQFLNDALTGIVADMKNPEGLESAETAINIVKKLAAQAFSIQDFSLGLSEAVRLYFIAYQVADSTTYVNPDEMDRAQGHGEAVNMKILRANEFSLKDGHVLLNPEERIIEAALGMFDARITGQFGEDNVRRAFHNAIHKLQTAFPTVIKVFGEQIENGFKQMQVSQEKQLGDL